MFGKKKEKKEGALEFKGGKIKSLLEKVSFLDNLDAEGMADEKIDAVQMKKDLYALKLEIRNCRSTWEDDSTLETALKDVVAVLERLCQSSKIELTEDELSYAFMGRHQGIFFTENHISSHCAEKYGDALMYFEKVKKSVENALAFEKRTRSDLAYDVIGNADAIARTVKNIETKTRQLEILDAIIADVKRRHKEENIEIFDCDEMAQSKKDEMEQEILCIPDLGHEELPEEAGEAKEEEIPEEPGGAEEGGSLEEPGEPEERGNPEDAEDTGEPQDGAKEDGGDAAEPEEPKEQKDLEKMKNTLIRHLFGRKEKCQKKAGDFEVKEAAPFQKVGEKRISCMERRKLLYLPELVLFQDKNGKKYLGAALNAGERAYANDDGSACLLTEQRQEFYDLLTLEYDPHLFGDADESMLAEGSHAMEWIYENYISLAGHKCPLRNYMEYKEYYSMCVKKYMQHIKKERERLGKAVMLSDEISRYIFLLGKGEGTPEQYRKMCIPLILNGSVSKITEKLKDIQKNDILDKELKERLHKLETYAGDIDSYPWGEEKKTVPIQENVSYAPVPAGLYGEMDGVFVNDTVVSHRINPEVKNARLLLKKESVSGTYSVDSVSPGNISYLVKEFYITMSYVKELGIAYNGENIFLIRYNNELKRPAAAMTKYEKHIKHYDRGTMGEVVSFYEQHYMQLLYAYADYNS